MSRSWEAGSTRRWRALRLRVLRRDHYQCQIQTPGICIGHATHADHIVVKSQGGTDQMDNLRAACQPCNLSRGAGQGPTRPEAPPDPEPTPRTTW